MAEVQAGGHRSLKEAGEVRKERQDIFRKHFRDKSL